MIVSLNLLIGNKITWLFLSLHHARWDIGVLLMNVGGSDGCFLHFSSQAGSHTDSHGCYQNISIKWTLINLSTFPQVSPENPFHRPDKWLPEAGWGIKQIVAWVLTIPYDGSVVLGDKSLFFFFCVVQGKGTESPWNSSGFYVLYDKYVLGVSDECL